MVSLFSLPSALLLHGFTVEKIHYQYLGNVLCVSLLLFYIDQVYAKPDELFSCSTTCSCNMGSIWIL